MKRKILYIITWIIILALLIFASISCSKRMYIPVTTTKTIIDTVTKTVPDSSLFMALFECDSLNQVRIKELAQYKGKEATQDVVFKDGALKVETRWRTQYIDRIKEITDTVTVVNEVEVVKQVKHIPTFFWWCFGIALTLILWEVFKLLRKFKIL